MRKKLIVALIACSASFILEREAEACGGCFIPTENPTVVTDHRMILSVSKEQSTLYDQIRYTGEPSSFAWVLPVSGTVEVGLSADIVFASLDGLTATSIIPPPQNCPPAPNCQSGNSLGRGTSDSAAGGGEVTVTKREVVGPYETVQLKATDPAALQSWLAANNFTVPPDVQPVVNQYVTEKFDFLALKLIPGKDVKDMRPVRVTTKGAVAVLPLRMVAAGTGPVVGISLWIVGEGRYEPQNFPSFIIATDEIAWDWTQSKSNYTEIRAARTTAGGGRAWEIESSTLVQRGDIENAIRTGFVPTPGGGRPGGAPQNPDDQYLPVQDAQGAVTKSAEQVRAEDLTTLTYGVPSASLRITRMRADLAHAALDVDLVMTASQDQAVLSNVRQLTKELNEPLCPVWNGCDPAGTAPRSEAAARSGGNESFSCSTAVTTIQRTSPAWIGLGAAFGALAVVQAIRRIRRNTK
ncbi:MAG: DUF2330 domain-containing protein [Labilithrix sp.]|nr:DUF2330 domain-containing protein [Labilithrix sp.]